MGWLFGKKKKVPKVPFPQGQHATSMQMPLKSSSKKVIEPSKVKDAVGIGKVPKPPQAPPPEKVMAPPLLQGRSPQRMVNLVPDQGPLYIKVNVYQRILGEIEDLKEDLSLLKSQAHKIEKSEFSEDNSFNSLRKSIKSLHDKLLGADKILFKT